MLVTVLTQKDLIQYIIIWMSKTLNFVSPNIVKNLTFSWLFGQTQL